MLSRSLLLLALLFTAGSIGAFGQSESEDPAALFNQAQDLQEKGDLAGAVKLYEKAIGILPEFPEAEYQRAAALNSLGRPDDALKGYLHAAKLRPDWPLPYSAAGGLLLDAGKFDEARTLLDKALELQPSDPVALSALADLYIRTKAAPSLLASLLDRVTLIASRSNATSAVWSTKAALENELGKPVASRISLEKALTLDPSDRNALMQMAQRALADADIEQAKALATRLATLSPGSLSVRILNAEVFLRTGQVEAAQKELEGLPAHQPAAAEIRARIQARTATSAEELEKQLAAFPNNAAVLGKLCGLYRKTDPAKALGFCKRASEAEPNNVEHAVGYGAALVQAKQYEQAAGLLRKLTDFAPDNWAAHANLATALFQLNRLAEAKREYDWLAEKQPAAAAPHLFLGIVHDRLGEFNDALLEYRAYIKLADPTLNKEDIDKINLRLPSLEKDIKKGKKN